MLRSYVTFFNEFKWFVACLIALNNFCDTLGRFLASLFVFPKKKWFLLVVAIRLIFVATFTLILKEVSFFNSNWFIILNMVLFALTNGYFATLGMAFGCDGDNEDPSLAGTIMGFHLMLGITVGSMIANVV